MRRGSAFEVSARAAELARQGRDVIRLEMGQSVQEPAPALVAALADAAREAPFGYSEPVGDMRVREVVAETYSCWSRRPLEPEQVALVPGSNLVLHLALLSLVGPGDEVLVPDPGFPVYAELVRMVGGVPVSYDVGQTVTGKVSHRTRLIVVNQPGNPTGRALGIDAARSLVDAAVGLGVHVLLDEAYRLFAGPASRAAARILEDVPPDRVIVMDSLSKSHALCGWRVGIGIFPAALIRDVATIAVNTHCCLPTPLQHAVTRALPLPELRAWERNHAAAQAVRLDRLTTLMRPPLVQEGPDGGFYGFPRIDWTGLSDVVLSHRLLDEVGVAVVPGSVFGAAGAGHIRISATRPLPEIDEGLRRLMGFLEAL